MCSYFWQGWNLLCSWSSCTYCLWWAGTLDWSPLSQALVLSAVWLDVNVLWPKKELTMPADTAVVLHCCKMETGSSLISKSWVLVHCLAWCCHLDMRAKNVERWCHHPFLLSFSHLSLGILSCLRMTEDQAWLEDPLMGVLHSIVSSPLPMATPQRHQKISGESELWLYHILAVPVAPCWGCPVLTPWWTEHWAFRYAIILHWVISNSRLITPSILVVPHNTLTLEHACFHDGPWVPYPSHYMALQWSNKTQMELQTEIHCHL